MTPSTVRLGARLARWDASALGVVANRRVSPTDLLLRSLTQAADHSKLWFGIAAMLGSRRGRSRRAAVRGVGAIGATSLLVNAVFKPLTPRHRPAHQLLPGHRALAVRKRPMSSSFPSGHAASAAAFTTAVALEYPRAAAVLAPVAALVAYSRVHVGVHWPSDVVTGAAIGASVAIATQRWWPVRGAEIATASRHADLPDLGIGEGLLALVNPDAGADGEDPTDTVRQRWPAARVLHSDPDADLVEQVRAAVAEGPVRALGVAGGDGTVAAVASVAAIEGLPLVVFPTGTLNHFARDNGIEDIETLGEAVWRQQGAMVDLGSVRVDDAPIRWFINTASLGGYPDMVRLREGWEDRVGKWPAAAGALIRVLRESEPLVLRVDGRPRTVWLLFVGNGRYRRRGLGVARSSVDCGTLDVRYVRADRRWSRTRFVAAALLGALERSRIYVQRDQPTLDIVVEGDPIALATDGGIATSGRVFRFTVRPDVLSIYRPETGQSDEVDSSLP